jgi:hypothetical protein
VSDPIIEHATIVFSDGVTGHIGRAPGFNLEIACERGVVTILADGPEIELQASENGNPYPVRRRLSGKVDAAPPQGTFAPVSQLVSCLRGDSGALADNAIVKEDVIRGQRVLFAIAQSHFNNSALTRLTDIVPDMVIHAISDGRYA